MFVCGFACDPNRMCHDFFAAVSPHRTCLRSVLVDLLLIRLSRPSFAQHMCIT